MKYSNHPTVVRLTSAINQAEPFASFNSFLKSCQHPFRPYRRFHPVPSGLSLSSLRSRFRHSRWSFFHRSVRHRSTSLRPLAPSPLRDFIATMSALTPVRRLFGTSVHEHLSCRVQVSLLHATDLPIPPSPTTAPPSDVAFARYPSAHRISHLRGSRLRHSLAGSPDQNGRIEFVVILRMDRSPPAAPHPASWQRSCSRLQVGERIPEEDFHLSGRVCSQAHECASLLAPWFGAACRAKKCQLP